MKQNKMAELSDEKLLKRKRFARVMFMIGVVILLIGIADVIYSLTYKEGKVRFSGLLGGIAVSLIFYAQIRTLNKELQSRKTKNAR